MGSQRVPKKETHTEAVPLHAVWKCFEAAGVPQCITMCHKMSQAMLTQSHSRALQHKKMQKIRQTKDTERHNKHQKAMKAGPLQLSFFCDSAT